MLKRWLVMNVLGLSVWGAASAQEPVTITGTRTQSIPASVSIPHGSRALRFQAARPAKHVALLKLNLTHATQRRLAQRVSDLATYSQSSPTLAHYPRAVQLGMNEVPVLDQGEHGTCMLFALTAALDAALGKGDYVSQLCQLDLSNYLNHHTYVESGWEGGWGQDFLNQIAMFGIVPKTLQSSGACAGRLEYPLFEGSVTDELSVFDYHQMSESIQGLGVGFAPLILEEQINSTLIDRERLLYKIKGILHQGDRVTCSVLLMGPEPGNANAAGSYHMANDTWILLPQMADELANDTQMAGHAFVITGYDDDAVAVDANGRLHRGLLTLRNSWGPQVGDHGDFYMTYTYFKATLLEAHRIGAFAP